MPSSSNDINDSDLSMEPCKFYEITFYNRAGIFFRVPKKYDDNMSLFKNLFAFA